MTGTLQQPMLQVDDLEVSFAQGKRRLKAVDGVGFAVQPGETFGVIGESGSGKSTLGRALVCLLHASHGRILHDGADPTRLDARQLRAHRRKFQMIFQDPHAALDPRMTILQSVREPLDLAGMGTRAERNARALQMLDRVSVSPQMAQRYPHELSGGQKQRANIARALVLEPRLLVCDEVVAALDVSIQADVLNLFMELQREFQLTYVFISHDLRVVSHVSDRVGVMYFGKMVEMGPAGALMQEPLHPYTQALLSAEPEAAPMGAAPRKRILLRGEIPSLAAPPSGCRFHTRCPHAVTRCVEAEPQWRQLTPGHFVACHFAGELAVAGDEAAVASPLPAPALRQFDEVLP